MKPLYTLLEFSSAKGPIYAVVKTADKNYALFGIRPLTDCIGYLRSRHIRKYIIDNGKTETLCEIPQPEKTDRKKVWFENFAERIIHHLESIKEKEIKLCVETKHEVDHCTITDSLTVTATLENGIASMMVYKHSGWSGSSVIGRIDYNPEKKTFTASSPELLPSLYEKSDNLCGKLDNLIYP